MIFPLEDIAEYLWSQGRDNLQLDQQERCACSQGQEAMKSLSCTVSQTLVRGVLPIVRARKEFGQDELDIQDKKRGNMRCV